MTDADSRRAFLTITGAAALLAACRNEEHAEGEPKPPSAEAPRTLDASQPDDRGDKGEDVGAVEDLMREHGVIRRVLVVYRETGARLRAKPASVPPDALQAAAKLMRDFGEDYHEKQLEEAYLFPAVRKAGGPAAGEIDTLLEQHQRGREITQYVLAVTQKTIGAAAAGPLARTLDAFARMYEEHAAREDTIVFPAWKKALSAKQLDELGDLFEDIEKKTFGKDGFDDAVDKIATIERMIGLTPAALTAPPPPKL